MSLRPTVGPSFRSSGAPWRWTLVSIALALIACSPAGAGSGTPGQPSRGLAASSAGVCQAIAALPDPAAAERAFTNVAHDPLHGLAGDPRLSRSLSARVLEAMQQVEADFSKTPDVAALSDDLAALHDSADAALQALGEEVPPCPA
jgi:hypothetical protein